MRQIKSEVYFPIIIAVHLVLWAVDLAMYDGSIALTQSESPVQRVIGEVMSSWVITVFGFNLLMTTRLVWVERIFGGLDKMYLIHRRSGIIAAVLLLLHFGTVPRHPDFTIGKPLGFAAMVLILLGIAFAASPLMKRKLPYDKWLNGHRLMGIFFVVGLAHALLVPTLISKLPLVRTYVFGMAFLGLASWIYRAFLFRWLRPSEGYTVTRARRYGKSVVELHMAPKESAVAYDAGQFAFFSFAEHSPNESHPFTIASSPAEDELRIVVKGSGDFTSDLIGKVDTSDGVQVEGPYGNLTQQHFGSDKQIWIAGGIGITPFLSPAHALAETERQATLYWSVHSKEDAIFDDELRELAATIDSFGYVLWESRQQGYSSADSAGGVEAFRGHDVVICGPAALRDSLTAQLELGGIKPRQIHNEEFAFR